MNIWPVRLALTCDHEDMFEQVKAGSLELGSLPSLWRKVDELYRAASTAKQGRIKQVVDPRMIDEGRVGGHRLYPLIERHLSNAQDCRMALRLVLRDHGATQCAMWNLLRGQFEAGFFALWLVDPDESRERVLRGIRVEWLDDRESRKYSREQLADPDLPIPEVVRREQLRQQARLDTDHDRVYGAECTGLGVDWTKPPRVNVTQELRELKYGQILGGAALLRHTWQSLAGLQHGDTGALLRVSDRLVTGVMPGGSLMTLTPSDTAFGILASTTESLVGLALARYLDCNRPARSNQAVDLAQITSLREWWQSL